jgi:Protein of unknown function (DUF2933)
MPRLGSQRLPVDVTTPPNGTGAPDSKPAVRYCSLCGRTRDPGEGAIDRFGEAFCWGAPLLVVTFVLAGGTGVVAGAAGAVLPFLAALACPLGMYFMMRGMSKMGDHGNTKDKTEDR